ncbi:AbrB family transcriptional regulator [Aquibacillus rhizosphaerae]|uniref:AbrB family transcriptional regulator n=1 Tax=Aquibacillus rhizosphaerae TaxID=3051431 RepID=A0ABT7L1J0_9BACI|nr:AbrB family transcriptional regulator [Aquibacillus sp. LR5S19]MDL4839708.1 AbrB family transcriptional regulator [Aquibacillus sp. LR5S19]
MKVKYGIQLGISYVAGISGGLLFHIIHLPLPWILGPLLAILLCKTFFQFKGRSSTRLRDICFSITGIQIGATFTDTTIDHVLPYLLPYSLLTIVLIAISLFNAYLLTKWIPIDIPTSLLGSVPGGLSAIIALSESVKANTALVTIFHTIRLMTVLFVIPFLATQLLAPGANGQEQLMEEIFVPQGPLWTIVILFAIYGLAVLLQHKVPAALVIIPMLIVAIFQIIDYPLYHLPNVFFLFAQLTIGIYLGFSVSIKDLKIAGKYCGYYFGLTIILLAVSFGLGYLFSLITPMNLVTAILSIAPGGLIEMALTAQSVSGDPSIVSSLQMIRMLTIVLLLPIGLKYLLPRLDKTKSSNNG